MTTAAEWLMQAATLTTEEKAEIAAAVLAAAQTTPIQSNIKQVNNVPITGTGAPDTDPWRPSGL
jgi:flagellar basal body rod protein FlgF